MPNLEKSIEFLKYYQIIFKMKHYELQLEIMDLLIILICFLEIATTRNALYLVRTRY